MEYFFNAKEKKRQIKRLKRHIPESVGLTNQGQNFIFESKWWVTIGQLWLAIIWNMLRSVNHVNSIQILYINPLSHFILQLRQCYLMHGDLTWLNPLLLNPLLGMLTYWQWWIIFLNGRKQDHLNKWRNKL